MGYVIELGRLEALEHKRGCSKISYRSPFYGILFFDFINVCKVYTCNIKNCF